MELRNEWIAVHLTEDTVISALASKVSIKTQSLF